MYEERSGRSDTVECGLEEEACHQVLKRLRDLGEGEFGWVRLVDPAEADVVQLAEGLGLHPLAVEDAVQAQQRPKRERFGDVLAVALKTLWYLEDETAVETGEMMLFVGPRYVLTVRHGPVDPAAEAARRLAANPGMLRFGPLSVLHAVLDVVVDAYSDSAEKVRTALTTLEDSVFSTTRVDHTQAIYSLKREVREFRDAVQPLVPVLQGLLSDPRQDDWESQDGQWSQDGQEGQEGQEGRNGQEGQYGQDAREWRDGPDGRDPRAHHLPKALPYFRDVADHLNRTDTEVRSLDELLNSVLDAQQARVGTWQNDDMRRISAWAAIFAIPTMVAGVYGMNFEHMPELGWSYGYPLALALMALASGALYRAFRRNGWL
ncbi:MULTISPECIES: magnesium and cobalt transport protein CorA [Streptomyces]|nr:MULTISPECIES: magnesium and cobalt transport protein CorA [Streptomyces]UUS33630.1 magnesium and cobalt transport protein CorA [Streptomyces changanensis]